VGAKRLRLLSRNERRAPLADSVLAKKQMPLSRAILFVVNYWRLSRADERFDRSNRCPSPDWIVGERIPDFALKVVAALEALAGILWIKASEVAELHVDAISIAEALSVRTLSVNCQCVQESA